MTTASTFTSTTKAEPVRNAWLQRHPLTAYFTIAIVGTWLLMLPWALDPALPQALGVLLFTLSPFAGPMLAAFAVTALTEGRPGVRALLRRYVILRVGIQWYAVALFGFLAVFVLGYSVAMNGAPLRGLASNWTLLLTAFLPGIAANLIIPFAEEPGWRGFALPRLQARHGALVATIILGLMHGLWHLPAFFTPALGPFTVERFVAFVLTAVGGTFLYTWIFNHTRGSIGIAILVHAASNAGSSLMALLVRPEDFVLSEPMAALIASGWFNVIVFGVTALILVAATRGRLGEPRRATQP